MKSKQSFDNFQAKLAQDLLDQDPDLQFFILDCFDNNFYPLFELIGKDNKIVIDYSENKLKLIMVRDQEGHFIDINKFDYPEKVKSYSYSLQELIELAHKEKDIEGYVVKFTDETLVKIKTLDYLEKHHLVSEADQLKVVFKRILEEDIDDVIALLPEDKKEKILEIEKCLTDYTVHFIKEIEDIVKEGDKGDRQNFVQKYIKHPWFSVIMAGLKSHDIKETLIKTMIKRYNKEEKVKSFLKDIGCL